MRSQDVLELLAVQRELETHDQGASFSVKSVIENFSEYSPRPYEKQGVTASRVFGAFDPHAALVGFSEAQRDPDDHAWLSKLWVHRAHRGEQRGGVYSSSLHTGVRIAEELLAVQEQTAHSWGSPALHLSVPHTQKAAQRFYEQHGFHENISNEFVRQMSKRL